MDEQVLRSLIKWPDVPECFGWLALDRRGQWRMRNEYAQQNKLPGSPIVHPVLNEFIGRNYARDPKGRYFFQNGPQRVYIALDVAPWIARLIPDANAFTLQTQCKSDIHAEGALCDEFGNIYITGLVTANRCEDFDDKVFKSEQRLSVALLHDHDLDLFSSFAKIEQAACSYKGSWNWNGIALPLDPITSEELGNRFGFIKNPQKA
jgi:Protein of unknown function (DUF2946)